MNRKQWEAWGKTRARGKRRYILQNIWVWGLAGGMYAVLDRLFLTNFSFVRLLEVELIAEMLAKGIFFSLLAGPLYGVITWRMYEKKYNKTSGIYQL
ncbi:hypothetical protein MO973_23205 [Paenibacillus sp. TRM 82003]|nr:hypothetical protein [Paenibacillus sp. TRM 82003]